MQDAVDQGGGQARILDDGGLPGRGRGVQHSELGAGAVRGEEPQRCGECAQQPSEADQGGSGLAIALGALLDGIPESIVIGLSVLGGGGIALLSGIAALIGHAAFGGFAPEVIAATIAVAAGGILAMLAETMVPDERGRARVHRANHRLRLPRRLRASEGRRVASWRGALAD